MKEEITYIIIHEFPTLNGDISKHIYYKTKNYKDAMDKWNNIDIEPSIDENEIIVKYEETKYGWSCYTFLKLPDTFIN